MPNIHQSSGSLSAASLQSNANNLPTNSGSSSPNLNAVSSHTNGNNRIHPPLQERSRNARAQARHRAKRKAYILQLEETVARLQAALSPNPPFNTSYPSSGAGGGSNTSSNDQSHLSPGIPLSSPNTLPNTVIGIGPPPAAGQGSAGSGDGNNFAARLRALELECSAVRTYAETLRGMLGHHAPGVQVPPPPLPSSLQPSASATTTGPPSAHSGTSSSFSSGLGSGAGETLPPLNSTFPPAPTSSSPGSYRVDASEKVAGVKRPRRDSHSRSLSSSGSGTDREGGEGSGFSTGDGGNISYTTSKATPPLNNKPSASIVPIHGNFPHSGVNSYALANSGSHHPPLILPPIPPSQPAPLQPLASQATTHVTPPPPYTYGASQSQQPLSSPLTAHQHHHQHQQHPSHPQSQTTHTNTHSQPQMTPMPPPIPAWGSNVGVSSVPSHGNNSAHAQSLHLPPPIPRLNGTSSTMSSLTRSFAYPLNASPSSTRQEGMDGSSSTDRNRFGSFSGGGIGAGIGASGNANMVLKREDDHETSLPANMHASGRHQHHETIHSISPTSATDTSPTSAIPQHQEHYHPQIPSPQGHQHTYQHQQSSATQRLLPSPVPHQHETQSHYSHHTSVPTISQPTQHQHAHLGHHHQAQPLHHHQQQQQHHHQQQQNTAAHGLPSPHSPYPPVSPNVSGEYRGYQEERYPHHQSSQQHTQTQAPHGHTHQQSQSQGQGQGQGQGQSQNHNENYLWPPAQAGAVYGGR